MEFSELYEIDQDDPPQYLKPGDEMELGIENLGTSKQKVIAFSK